MKSLIVNDSLERMANNVLHQQSRCCTWIKMDYFCRIQKL